MVDFERDKLKTSIEQRVAENWNSNHTALLLSRLGGPIRREFPNLEDLLEGMKFRDFVRTCPGVRLVSDPRVKEKIGAVPANANVPFDGAELFKEIGSTVSEVASRSGTRASTTPYYSPNFWRAFHTPLAGRRFVIPSDENSPVRIVDGEIGESEKGYEILESDLTLLPAGTPMVERVKSVSTKILAWLARHDLTDQPFRGRPTPAPATSNDEKRVSEVISEVIANPPFLLSDVLAGLHPSEQARISVPLDLVIKLLSGRK